MIADGRQPCVLVADDDYGMRQALRVRLAARGYDVVECSDGIGVLAKCTRGVDVIILDHHMPVGEGRSIASAVRARCAAPIIFLSGQAPDDFRDVVTALSDTYYLGKPLDDKKLFSLLASVAAAPHTAVS